MALSKFKVKLDYTNGSDVFTLPSNEAIDTVRGAIETFFDTKASLTAEETASATLAKSTAVDYSRVELQVVNDKGSKAYLTLFIDDSKTIADIETAFLTKDINGVVGIDKVIISSWSDISAT